MVGSLPKYFNKEEFDVRVILPKYSCMAEPYKSQLEYVSHFYMYYNNKEIFRIVNGNPNDNNGNYSLYLGGNHVMLADRTGTKFGNGISGTFTSADGKTVMVEGGIITDIRYSI